MGLGCRDSISSLPDEIIGKILSLLPTKVAASTSVLSKRWRNLLCLVDNLCFDESMVEYANEEEAVSGSVRFCDFVEKTFVLLRNSPIKKISLSHLPRCGCASDYDRVYRWIYIAMERGLLELHLHATRRYTCVFLKRDLLTSNMLVKLTLSCAYWYEFEFKHVSFPVLKSLSLLSVSALDFRDYVLLLDGCPILEDLSITEADHSSVPCCSAAVENDSIKRLVVFSDLPDFQEDHDSMLFNAPSLVYLDYSSYVFARHQFVDLDSLVEARLNLRLWESTSDYDYSDDDDDDEYDDYNDYYLDEFYYGTKEPIYGDVTELVAGITSITTLHLSPDSLEAFHFCCESMPVFNNLRNLSIESNKEKGWQVMPLLLKSCPNLHTLVMKGLVHRVTNRCGDACACVPEKKKKKEEEEEVCCLWTCQVKVVEVSEYRGSFQELKQMRHFLGKLKCLETVKVGVDADNKSELLRANLRILPRISSNCKLEFI